MMESPPTHLPTLLSVRDLRVHYPVRSGFFNFGHRRFLKAVDGVSLELKTGETLGIVGESGCGKSSLGKAIVRLVRPTDGGVEIGGVDFLTLDGRALRKARTQIQMIFQDPYASLDPRMTIFDCLAEPIRGHRRLTPLQRSKKITDSLERVGLSIAAAKKYPHEFSGGQRQRIAIARSLMLDPKVIIADEPVSSLDVSVQAQILNLLKDIQRELGLSMIFISHNLAVVKYISDRIAVMYLGKFVEIADAKGIFTSPMHPYTQALISAVPIPDPIAEKNRARITLRGEPPSPRNPPQGCAFHPRCPLATQICREKTPALKSYAGTRLASCFDVEKGK